MTGKLPPAELRGFYRHFKGGIYQVFGIAKDIDTDTWFVIYGKAESWAGGCAFRQPFQEIRPEFARSHDIFFSSIDVDGEARPRYQYLGNSPITP